MSLFKNKKILVTGGTGSLGKELVRWGGGAELGNCIAGAIQHNSKKHEKNRPYKHDYSKHAQMRSKIIS